MLADIEIVRLQHERRTEAARATHERGTDISNINALQANLQRVHEQLAEERHQRLVNQARYEQQINDLRHQLGQFEGTETELRACLVDKDEQISDLRSERDRLLGVIEAQTEQVKLLTDQRQQPQNPQSPAGAVGSAARPQQPRPSQACLRSLA